MVVVTNRSGKCTLLYVPSVAKTPKYPSSPGKEDRCIAASAIVKKD